MLPGKAAAMKAVEVQKWKFRGTEEITWGTKYYKVGQSSVEKLAKIHTQLTMNMETLIALTDCPSFQPAFYSFWVL